MRTTNTITAKCECGDSITFDKPSIDQEMTAYGYQRSNSELRREWLDWHQDECALNEHWRRNAGSEAWGHCAPLGARQWDGDGNL